MTMGSLLISISVQLITAIVILITSLYYFSIKTFDHWKNRHVKFMKPVPFFGNSLYTIFRKKTLAENQQEIYNSFPEEKYIGMFLFRIPILMVRDPQLIHRILSKDYIHFYDRGITTDERLDLLSLHLVNLKGQQWKSLRNKLTPAFSSGKLKTMCPQVEECASALSELLDSSAKLNCCMDLLEIMAKFATDVIGACAFGLQMDSLRDPDSLFRKMGREIFKPSPRVALKFITRAFHPKIPYYLNLKLLHNDVENFFLNFVKDAVYEREENQVEKKDFIQILMELRKDDVTVTNCENSKEKNFVLSDQALASNVFAFFLGGFETISSTMSFFLLELAANPKIQDAVRSEILQSIDGEFNYDAMKNIPYMEMVISETLRKYPIGTVLLRECTQTYQVPDTSFVIEEGTRILIPVFALHYDPRYFPDPERFDPERFSPENKSKILQGTYLPFGDGPRVCIGLRFAMMEMKYAFCKILPKYEFTLSDRTVYPVKFKKGVPLLAAQDGIWLNVKAIN